MPDIPTLLHPKRRKSPAWARPSSCSLLPGCIVGGLYLLGVKKPSQRRDRHKFRQRATVPAAAPGPAVEINIAYGTEKERWLKWAAQEFAQTKEGASVKINLLPYGSLEGAQAALSADKQITVWSPASGLYKENFAARLAVALQRPGHRARGPAGVDADGVRHVGGALRCVHQEIRRREFQDHRAGAGRDRAGKASPTGRNGGCSSSATRTRTNPTAG